MENNVDLISRERQDSLKTVLSRMKELRCQAAMEPNDPYMTMIKAMLDTLIQHFEKFPAVDAQPVVHGRWKYLTTTADAFAVVKCSNCGQKAFAIAEYVRKGNYCPNCGAKMN